MSTVPYTIPPWMVTDLMIKRAIEDATMFVGDSWGVELENGVQYL